MRWTLRAAVRREWVEQENALVSVHEGDLVEGRKLRLQGQRFMRQSRLYRISVIGRCI